MDTARVDELLRVRGWRRADLARAIDVNDERMTKWLAYGQSPSGYDAARIAIVLDVDVADLFQIKRDASVWNELRSVLALLPPDERGAVLGFAESLARRLGSTRAPQPTTTPASSRRRRTA